MDSNLYENILLAHGGGGIMMRELIGMITERLGRTRRGGLQDSAILEVEGKRIAFTTDSFVVKPIFFPGGDIGHLSVCGTVNDLAVSGATPLFISLSYIIEEGFPVADLARISSSVQKAAEEAGVKVVTGDTKVVHRGAADGLFINTSGIGLIPEGVDISSSYARDKDAVIVNGSLGDHGLAILSVREGIDFGTSLKSDAAPLSLVTVGLLERFNGIRCMRDATRGGLAAVLNEIAADSRACVRIEEASLPISDEVAKGCELMGYEPLHIANEGKFVVVADPSEAESIVEELRKHPLGREARIIGEIGTDPKGTVVMNTAIGGERVVDFPYGDILPRIC